MMKYLNVDPSLPRPSRVNSRVPRPSLFCFFWRSSTSLYYTKRKPKNTKKKLGRPGNEAIKHLGVQF